MFRHNQFSSAISQDCVQFVQTLSIGIVSFHTSSQAIKFQLGVFFLSLPNFHGFDRLKRELRLSLDEITVDAVYLATSEMKTMIFVKHFYQTGDVFFTI
jgi:hypothetical protein